jgi:hypothetical protein
MADSFPKPPTLKKRDFKPVIKLLFMFEDGQGMIVVFVGFYTQWLSEILNIGMDCES